MNGMLITGANRGLGLGMIKAVLNLPKESIPSNIVAACRTPEEAKMPSYKGFNRVIDDARIITNRVTGHQHWITSEELKVLAGENTDKTQIHVVKLECRDFDSYSDFAQNVSGILKNGGLNLLINNAGVGSRFHRIGMVKKDELIDTFTINTVAPIMLTKALLPLLKVGADNSSAPKGEVKARIVNLSSILGSIGLNGDGGHYSYRASKAALNAATVSMKVDLKGTGICAVAIHPGWVQTEMGGPKAPLQVPDACRRIVNTIVSLKEDHNGGFWDLDGKKLPW